DRPCRAAERHSRSCRSLAGPVIGCGAARGGGRIDQRPATAERLVELDERARSCRAAGGEALARGEELALGLVERLEVDQARAILDAREDRAVAGGVERDRELGLAALRGVERGERVLDVLERDQHRLPVAGERRLRRRALRTDLRAQRAAVEQRLAERAEQPARDRVKEAAQREGRGADVPGQAK